MEANDAELMARLAGGDDLSLNALMLRWREKVAAFLLRMTGHPDVAGDLAHETFVKLYLARHRYRPTAKFSTYLFGIAANLARNHARWKSRHPAVSLDGDEGVALLAEAADDGLSPEEAAMSAERLRAVQLAVECLPADLREAISLFVDEDMSYAEIATMAGCTAKAAETRIYRARQLLKESLKDVRR